MEGLCIVVESKDSSGGLLSCSGIRMNKNFILTHCCIVWTLIEKYIDEIQIDKTVSNTTHMEKSIISYLKNENLKYRVITSDKAIHLHKLKNCPNVNNNSVVSFEANFENLLIPPMLFNSLFQLLSKDDWNFLTKENDLTTMKKTKISKPKTSHMMKDTLKNAFYLSTFLILKIGEGDFSDCLRKFEAITSVPNKGDYIFLEGSPFGSNAPTLLLNSISQGIIGNIIPDGHLFITDARCTVGCEGGPAYSCGESLKVCGIILSPNCSLTGNWVGLTFVAAIRPLLIYMKKKVYGKDLIISTYDTHLVDEICSRTDISYIKNSLLTSNVVKLMELSIVRISVKKNNGFSWGSGVVVNAQEGIIISCAHVVKDATDEMVEVGFSNGDIHYGSILYQSNIQYETKKHQYNIENNNAWDITVIRMSNTSNYALPLAQELPLVGTSVMNGGHSLFWKDSLLTPTFSLGNLAKIVELPNAHFRHNSKKFIRDLELMSPNYIDKKMDVKDINLLNLYNCPVDHERAESSKNVVKVNLSTEFICYEWKSYDELSSSFPAMLQTTCAVYNGLSGGPVVAIHPNKGPVVIGIVTSCVQSKNVDVLFPHVNMAVPSYFISKAVENYIISKDPNDFNILSINSPEAVNLCTFKNKLFSRL